MESTDQELQAYFNTMTTQTILTSIQATNGSMSAAATASASQNFVPSSSLPTVMATNTSFPSVSGNGMLGSDPHMFPTALVAVLCTLLPLAAIVALLFYLWHRRRTQSPNAGDDKYVWGPLGLVRRCSRNKENPVLKAQETEAKVDPIAEAIRQEERERLGRMKRSGEARFYAPNVRNMVEYIGSRERMKVIIDWRDKVKIERPW
jgi:hypothetical protein